MNQPAPVNRDLIERAAAVARRRPAHHPLDPPDGEGPLDPEDMATARARGIDDLRAEQWIDAIPNRFRWANLDDVQAQHPELDNDLRAWSADPGSRNLVLLGAVGTGKSYTACAAVREACFDGLNCQFLPVDEVLDLLRPGGPDRALYELAAIDRLIIDDLGAERATDWTADRLFALVNRRWLEERPTVVTSNLPATGLEAAVGDRLFSRLVGSGAVVLQLAGHDRRRRRP